MASLGSVRRKIKKAYKEAQNWRVVAEQFGITVAMAWRIANQDYEPKDPKIRVKLGLSALAPAPVCERCGEVHVSKRCTSRQRKHRDLFAMDVNELRKALINRKEW